MRLRLFVFAFFMIFTNSHVFAQTQSTEINQKDEKGKPQGLWYTYMPAERGEPSQSVFGQYEHGDKVGAWYTSNGKGDLISIETYKFNERDGEAKYFENGHLTCIGHYRGLNPKTSVDTVLVVDPITGDEKLVNVPTERGSVRHGSWRFYDEFSGRLIKEEYYQIDELLYKKDFSISPSDSMHYEMRNRLLPHNANKMPASKFKPKSPTRSLIGG